MNNHDFNYAICVDLNIPFITDPGQKFKITLLEKLPVIFLSEYQDFQNELFRCLLQ